MEKTIVFADHSPDFYTSVAQPFNGMNSIAENVGLSKEHGYRLVFYQYNIDPEITTVMDPDRLICQLEATPSALTLLDPDGFRDKEDASLPDSLCRRLTEYNRHHNLICLTFGDQRQLKELGIPTFSKAMPFRDLTNYIKAAADRTLDNRM